MIQKCYLEAKFQNSEGTLFSPIFKVGEKKVLLFFHFELKIARYSHFLVFFNFPIVSPFVNFEGPVGDLKLIFSKKNWA